MRRLEGSEGPVYICIQVDVAVGGTERSGRSDRLLSSLLSSVFLKGESQVSNSCSSRGGRYVDSAPSDRRTLMKCDLLQRYRIVLVLIPTKYCTFIKMRQILTKKILTALRFKIYH